MPLKHHNPMFFDRTGLAKPLMFLPARPFSGVNGIRNPVMDVRQDAPLFPCKMITSYHWSRLGIFEIVIDSVCKPQAFGDVHLVVHATVLLAHGSYYPSLVVHEALRLRVVCRQADMEWFRRQPTWKRVVLQFTLFIPRSQLIELS